MSFSIDEARDTFTADVTRLIGQIQGAADLLLAYDVPLTPRVGPYERPAFEAAAELGHALVGTTALVGAESLAGSGRLLEELAGAGAESLRQMALHAERASHYARLCADGAVQMRS